LGLIPPKTSADKAHRILEALVPPDLYLPFHLNLITHGRQVCHARGPQCEVCMLKRVCQYYKDVTSP
jgi:endonuclease-3